MTFYDPATRTVRDADGNIVTAAAGAPAAQSELGTNAAQSALATLPSALPDEAKLYACETADYATVAMLAKVANSTIAQLEYRRHHWSATPELTPLCEVLPTDRRRCLKCPYWTLHPEATPF